MNYTQAIVSGFINVVNFNGRASRSENNFWLLFILSIQIFAVLLDPPEPKLVNSSPPVELDIPLDVDEGQNYEYDPMGSRLFSFLYFLLLLPTTSLAVRRFHDIGKSGWNILWPFTIVGAIPYYYWICFVKGDSEKNEYGDNPLDKKINSNHRLGNED